MHRSKMSLRVLLFGWLCLCTSLVTAAGEEGNRLEYTWRRIPTSGEPFRAASDEAGLLWVMTDRGLCYWDGSACVAPAGPKLGVGDRQYQIAFVGGPDRGVYLPQRGAGEHQGTLYRLSDGEALHVTDFYYESPHNTPNIYVSKSGMLFNWGTRFLAVYKDGMWHRQEALVGPRQPEILDTGQEVHFCRAGRIWSCGTDGTFTERELPEAARDTKDSLVRAYLWGRDRMLCFRSSISWVAGFQLSTLEPVPIGDVVAALKDCEFYRGSSRDGGDVLIDSYIRRSDKSVCFRIAPDGTLSEISQVGDLTRYVRWSTAHRDTVLSSPDGTVWFALDTGGVALYSDGGVRVFGWRDGLPVGTAHQIVQGPADTVYLASSAGLFACSVARPAEVTQEPPPRWADFLLASGSLVRDGDGNMWLLRRDRPGEASRWDGAQWTHVPVRFDTSRVSGMMADDRGHLLLQMDDPPSGSYDVSLDRVKPYASFNDLLVDAVRGGARRFFCDRSFQGCWVLDGERIWYGRHRYHEMHYFDGQHWDRFGMSDNVNYMHESSRHGVLFQLQGWKYYTYERGQIVEVPAHTDRWLLGPKSVQPMEEALLQARPKEYLPLEGSRQTGFCLVSPLRDAEAERFAPPDEFRVSAYVEGVVPSAFGGFWLDGTGRTGEIDRVLAGRIWRSDFAGTPLAGARDLVRRTFEDRGHNLWFELDQPWVFWKRLDDFGLELAPVPQEVTRSLALEGRPVPDDVAKDQVRLLWRLKGGEWNVGDPGCSAQVFFPQGGHYEVEVTAMDSQGGTCPRSKSISVTAVVPMPETIVTAEGPYRVTGVVWKVPVKAVPSELGARVDIVYRIDGGPWRQAKEGGLVAMDGVGVGEHHVELAAREVGVIRDPSPVLLSFTWEPDH